MKKRGNFTSEETSSGKIEREEKGKKKLSETSRRIN